MTRKFSLGDQILEIRFLSNFRNLILNQIFEIWFREQIPWRIRFPLEICFPGPNFIGNLVLGNIFSREFDPPLNICSVCSWETNFLEWGNKFLGEFDPLSGYLFHTFFQMGTNHGNCYQKSRRVSTTKWVLYISQGNNIHNTRGIYSSFHQHGWNHILHREHCIIFLENLAGFRQVQAENQ